MKDAILEYEILNWQRWNPRTDARRTNWCRLDADMASSPDCVRMEDKVFRTWVALLCHASRGSGKGRLALSLLSATTRSNLRRTLDAVEWLKNSMMLEAETKLPERKTLLRNGTERNVTIRNDTISHSLTSLSSRDSSLAEVGERVGGEEADFSTSDFDERKDSMTVDERAVIAYAESKLDRSIGQREAENFVAEWRQKPRLTADRIRRAIDWVASHPLARIETRSIVRLLHDTQARQAYFEWDKKVIRDVRQMLDLGMEAPEIIARMVENCVPLDREVFRAYLERVCGVKSKESDERQAHVG